MNIYHGNAVSQGIEIGFAVTLANTEKISIPKLKILDEEKDPSWKRFEEATKSVIDYYEKLKEGSNKEQTDLIETYIMMLTDKSFIEDLKNSFYKSNFNLEYCIKQKIDEQSAFLRNSSDSYFLDRANDIEEIFGKVVRTLLGVQNSKDNEAVTSDSVVFAENITTANAMSFFKHGIKGLVLKEGGASSHISILARTYGIPTLIGVDNPTQIVQTGNKVIIDTTKSIFISEPDKITELEYEKRIKEQKQKHLELNKFIKKKAQTKDGVTVKLFANISSVEEAEIAKREGADGIGLFRTEFLFMNDDENVKTATENEQYKIYSQVLKIMGSKPVTIRTLDCGGDKITFLNDALADTEANPLLGCRAIRFCLNRPDIFKTQLRALFRASVNGNLQILLPLITNYSQIVQTKKLIEEVKKELDSEKIPYKKNIPLGIMIETPCAAIMIDDLGRNCDFFSIGSNDLTQYMIAVDRENSSVSHLYNELNPSVLRVVSWTAWVAKQFGKPISVCGEMASQQEAISHLLSYGIRNFSVNPNSISSTKAFLAKISSTELKKLSSNSLWNKNILAKADEFYEEQIKYNLVENID